MMKKPRDRRVTLALLILFQMLCMGFFLFDLIQDMDGLAASWAGLGHFLPEAGATLGLFIALLFEGRYLLRLLRRQKHMEHTLSVAAGAMAELMEGYFRQWGLTASEQDVATFTIKGYSIAEIAELRGSAEATVKTHLNAIYRKSGTTGRGQLVSILIEDLMRAPLVAGKALPGQNAPTGETPKSGYSPAA